MTLGVIPEGLEGASAVIEALTAHLATVHAEAAPFIMEVIPPGSGSVSVQNQVGFNVHGCQYVAMTAHGAEELGRWGVGVAESGVSYALRDAFAVASYLGGGL
ncbi:PE-family protein [Mycobacterium leprae Kyoto-2]|uniref:PE-family protein n=3 Tax=Mycobacterium leprae TaxID=1769 RepID=Q9CCR0_MYCLE|nr:PE family protein [Mycobacterium leprae]CAR70631.1 PE-family protein [Mycobacterium leprae Br4923]AWV47419.1 PE family protein [Mycobacterium leprae]OAR20207.1 cell motility protein [Mycobacterium leprae 3125609]OAX71654.1 cell motility protein [Mycobacterium leprae 7935681]CAC30046.1 PE-family protein [Mycobacterium leprae]